MDIQQSDQKHPPAWKLALLDLASICAWLAVCAFLFYLWRG